MTSSNGNIFRVTGPLVWRIHRLPVNFPHKGQWRWALMFSLICAWMNGWANNREARDLIRHCAHCDVIVMSTVTTTRLIYIPWNMHIVLSCFVLFWLGLCKSAVKMDLGEIWNFIFRTIGDIYAIISYFYTAWRLHYALQYRVIALASSKTRTCIILYK